MILGFTGTRRGMTPFQRANLPKVLAALPSRFLHGGAVGADEEIDAFLAPMYHAQTSGSARLFAMITGADLPIVVYPTRDRYEHWKSEAPFPAVREVNEPYDNPLARNRIIARYCDHLLAAPATVKEVRRSGTWATVRYAREARKPVTILLPWPVPWFETGIVELMSVPADKNLI